MSTSTEQHHAIQLPTELLEQIFIINSTPDSDFRVGLPHILNALHISSVCCQWRAVSLSYSLLWKNCISLSQTLWHPDILSRSMPALLDLDIGVPLHPDAVKVVTAPNVSARIRSIVLKQITPDDSQQNFLQELFRNDTPSLQHLVIDSIDMRSQTVYRIDQGAVCRAPQLKVLTCRSGGDFALSGIPPCSFRNLKSFSYSPNMFASVLCMATIGEWLDALSEMKNLRYLELSTQMRPSEADISEYGVISFPYVKRFVFETGTNTLVDLLPKLDFPQLRFLKARVSLQHQDHAPIILGSLSRYLGGGLRQFKPEVVSVKLDRWVSFRATTQEDFDQLYQGFNVSFSPDDLSLGLPSAARLQEINIGILKNFLSIIAGTYRYLDSVTSLRLLLFNQKWKPNLDTPQCRDFAFSLYGYLLNLVDTDLISSVFDPVTSFFFYVDWLAERQDSETEKDSFVNWKTKALTVRLANDAIDPESYPLRTLLSLGFCGEYKEDEVSGHSERQTLRFERR